MYWSSSGSLWKASWISCNALCSALVFLPRAAIFLFVLFIADCASSCAIFNLSEKQCDKLLLDLENALLKEKNYIFFGGYDDAHSEDAGRKHRRIKKSSFP